MQLFFFESYTVLCNEYFQPFEDPLVSFAVEWLYLLNWKYRVGLIGCRATSVCLGTSGLMGFSYLRHLLVEWPSLSDLQGRFLSLSWWGWCFLLFLRYLPLRCLSPVINLFQLLRKGLPPPSVMMPFAVFICSCIIIAVLVCIVLLLFFFFSLFLSVPSLVAVS